jgi:ABC-2 type transport system ATP-binding protein
MVKPLIGYVPDSFGVYENMRTQEYLQFFAAAYRIEGDAQLRVVDEVLELTDLTYKRNDLVLSLSRGMQQRLGLARSLLHNPEVLLLDEPASGLDPRARVEMREVLKELQRLGKSILISSHILSELEEMCNKVVIVERGEAVFSGGIDELRRKARGSRNLEIGVESWTERAVSLLEREPFVQSVQMQNGTIRLALQPDAPPPSHFSRLLTQNGFVLTRLFEEEPSLEDVFMEITRGLVA